MQGNDRVVADVLLIILGRRSLFGSLALANPSWLPLVPHVNNSLRSKHHDTLTSNFEAICVLTDQSLHTLPYSRSNSIVCATMSLNPRTPGANHTHGTSRLSTVPTSTSKTRQLSHLHAQLAQLTANMSDMENLLRMTAVQAEGMRGLGGYAGGM